MNSPGMKFTKTRTQTRQTISRALTSTSPSKQGHMNNNRVPKRRKSQSKPSLSKVQLRSRRRRRAEPKALAKEETCSLGLRDSKVSLCKSISIKEKDTQVLVQQTIGQRGCLTRHAAKESSSLPGVQGCDGSQSSYRTRRSTRTMVKAQESAAGVKLEHSALEGFSPVPGGVVIKTEPADMEEYLHREMRLDQGMLDTGYARRGSCTTRKRPTPHRPERTIKCEDYGEALMSVGATAHAANFTDCSNVRLAFPDRHRDYKSVRNGSKLCNNQ